MVKKQYIIERNVEAYLIYGDSMKLDEALEILEDRGYLVESKMNLIRGGKGTNTFKIMNYIVQQGGEARTMDIAHTF